MRNSLTHMLSTQDCVVRVLRACWVIDCSIAGNHTEARVRGLQVTGGMRIGGAAIEPAADTIRGGADEDWGDALVGDELVAEKPSSASAKAWAPLPVIMNGPPTSNWRRPHAAGPCGRSVRPSTMSGARSRV